MKLPASQYTDDLKDLLNLTSGFNPERRQRVIDAFAFAERAHAEQKRKSGEPYFIHLIETAKNVAKLGLGSKSIAAALLHDSIEDGVATEDEVKDQFGQEIFEMVDGVTKLEKVRYQGMRRHNESLRKLFIATSKDVRVIIIKLCDRIHNMQTLQHVAPEKRERIAAETLEIYAPLAYRLGITALSRELEDLAFPYVYPDAYQKVRQILKDRSKQTFEKLAKVDRSIKKKLAENNLLNFNTTQRIKGLYSLYKKLLRKKWDIAKIYDIAALRILVDTTAECYQVLGIIHQNYRPVPGRIKDYIAFEKPNGYQSIHTTIFTGDGGIVEVQIRTHHMHRTAEYGAAAHVSYKQATAGLHASPSDASWISKLLTNFWVDNGNNADQSGQSPAWLSKLAEHADEPESDVFVEKLRQDFFEHRIFAFTPLGQVIDLPEGSTPIDFAFLVHTEVGLRAAGCKINSKMSALSTTLQNGDIVEIITKDSAKPSHKWLDIAKTNEAKRKIKASLAREQSE